MSTLVSIFNDVIGPVMRGPSSSHCAAALRIGRLARDLMSENIESVLLQFDRSGSLPTTHDSQGSDMGLFGGLLGWNADDERLPESDASLAQQGISIQFETVDVGDPHPNTYRLNLKNNQEQHSLVAISTGGGMIEVIEIDGFKLSMLGDYCETLILLKPNKPVEENHIKTWVESRIECDEVMEIRQNDLILIQIKSKSFSDSAGFEEIKNLGQLLWTKQLDRVLPVRSYRCMQVPFKTCNELIAFDNARGQPFCELAIQY